MDEKLLSKEEALETLRQMKANGERPLFIVGKVTPFNPDDPENYPEWGGYLSPPPPSQEEIDRMLAHLRRAEEK